MIELLLYTALCKFSLGWFEMDTINHERREETVDVLVPATNEVSRVANDICEKALNDAKEQLHPLIRNAALNHLRNRSEFGQAFKLALEQRIAQKLASWQPNIQAVFKFDESWMEARDKSWDGSIHLLVKVPRLSNAIKMIGKSLDQNLTHCLQQLGWSPFLKHQSILDIQQVTPNELRHGVGYGALFCAVHSVPVKVWSPKR